MYRVSLKGFPQVPRLKGCNVPPHSKKCTASESRNLGTNFFEGLCNGRKLFANTSIVSFYRRLPFFMCSTERGVLSVARFCYVLPCELQGPVWAVGSCSISQSVGGASQNIIFKTLRQPEHPTLYRTSEERISLATEASLSRAMYNIDYNDSS